MERRARRKIQLGVLAIAAVLLITSAVEAPRGPAIEAPLSVASSPAPIYYNGTVDGNGGTQTVDLPTPANGTVWDLVSAKITITAADPVSTSQNSYLYDSTCTQLDVSPAGSNCEGIFGPNVDGWANDIMDSGQDGTNTGAGGYTATAPPGLVQYTRWDQTIHVTYDTFTSFGADLSSGVSSTYRVVLQPESGDFPSFAYYRWSSAVSPLSSTPTAVAIPGPPSGYVYRAEMAVSTIDLGSNSLTPTRSAELLEEPSGTVLSEIDSWSIAGPGITEDACGGYSAGQTCTSDPTGTATVWTAQVFVSSSESMEARFVGASGDTGVFGVVVTEYPANDTPPSLGSGSGGGGGGSGGGVLPMSGGSLASLAAVGALGAIALLVVYTASHRGSAPRRRTR